MNLIEEIQKTLPLIEETAKCHNRSLLIDLIDPIISKINKEIQGAQGEDERRILSGIKRELKAYLTRSAYTEKREDETLSIEDEREKQGALPGEPESMTEKAAGVVQPGSRETRPGTMRDVFVSTGGAEKKIDIFEKELDNLIGVCESREYESKELDSPFSIEDFAVQVQEQKISTYDELIREVDRMIEEVQDDRLG